jgi:hydroxymethylglutaryl-CoA synthase
MSSILSYGVYLPHYRIAEEVLDPQSNKKGNRAVGYVDEDIITMAYEAARDCLKTSTLPDPKSAIDGIFFATISPVFSNRYHSSYFADLLDVPKEIMSLDFCATPRAATDALLLANQLVDSGACNNILIIAAEINFSAIGDEAKKSFGHGASALWIGDGKGIAQIESARSFSSAIAEEFIYKNAEIFLDPRFSRDAGFKSNTSAALEKLNIKATDYDALVLNALYAKLAGGIFISKVFSEKQFAKDRITSAVGYTGVNHALLQLIDTIENGARSILLFDYFNGTNVFSIHSNGKGKTQSSPSNKIPVNIETYQDYLKIKKVCDFNSAEYKSTDMFTSEIMNDREKQGSVYLHAFECEACGTKYFIKTARCRNCKGDKFTNVPLRETGTVYTLTKEYYFPASFAPITMVVIDLDGGGRMTVQLTDDMYPAEKEQVKIGSRVKLVLRKMMESGEKPGYFFKCVITE